MEWNDAIPDATPVERLAAKVLLRKSGTTDPVECPTTDFAQKGPTNIYRATVPASGYDVPAFRASRFGYSSSYKALVLGDVSGGENATVCIGYDPLAVTSGSFIGDGTEVFFRNGAAFTTPNSANTGFHNNVLVLKDGNVIIGAPTTLNGGRFHLNFTGSNGAVLQTDSSAFQYQMQFYISGVRVGSISTSGSATAYNTSSDYRLKDIDGPITNSGEFIDALNPVQGSWKADGSRFIGLIAHEVQEVAETPIATGEKDGEEMQGMSYSAPELIAQMVAELKSLRARVAQLEAR